MDERGRKLHGNRKIARGKITCIVMTIFNKPKRSLPYNLKVDPVQFQVNPCNFEIKLHDPDVRVLYWCRK